MENRVVTHEFAGSRLDVFLAHQFTEYSRSAIQKAIEKHGAVVNEKLITISKHHLTEGDTVSFILPQTTSLEPVALPLDILFEDESILVINKPVGLIVHPTTTEGPTTLVHALLHHYPDIAAVVYEEGNPVSMLRPGIVHRLDKDTSGVLVVAKTKEALTKLAEQFQQHQTSKEYQVVLYGTLTSVRKVDAPIHRKGGGRQNLMGASHTRGKGREAESIFTPVKISTPYPAWPKDTVTLCKVAITTGRTHQIRVHAKFIGYPVLGDSLYTNKPAQKLASKLGTPRQLLHAASLTFTHPETQEVLTFRAPLPKDMQSFE
jgi:23S rRNA pseudouridine1911/1915/1917 synthase